MPPCHTGHATYWEPIRQRAERHGFSRRIKKKKTWRDYIGSMEPHKAPTSAFCHLLASGQAGRPARTTVFLSAHVCSIVVQERFCGHFLLFSRVRYRYHDTAYIHICLTLVKYLICVRFCFGPISAYDQIRSLPFYTGFAGEQGYM